MHIYENIHSIYTAADIEFHDAPLNIDHSPPLSSGLALSDLVNALPESSGAGAVILSASRHYFALVARVSG